MLRKFFALIILFSAVSAHPVIFKNGKVFWLTQNPSFNDIRFGVSKSSNWLIGGRFLEDRKSNETFALINNNYLAKRWNNRNSQANLYLLCRCIVPSPTAAWACTTCSPERTTIWRWWRGRCGCRLSLWSTLTRSRSMRC